MNNTTVSIHNNIHRTQMTTSARHQQQQQGMRSPIRPAMQHRNPFLRKQQQVLRRLPSEPDLCRRNHFHAQYLNNTAADYIESGCYQQAVTVLVKALCLSPTNQCVSPTLKVCNCSKCSLDACIVYSEERAKDQEEARSSKRRSLPFKKRKYNPQSTTKSERDSSEETQQHHRSDLKTGYTHKKPIRVPPKVIEECHVMGSTLSLIVTFNLALANHLLLISIQPNKEATRIQLAKVLRLYELAYRWESEFRQQQQSCESNSNSDDSDMETDSPKREGSNNNDSCSKNNKHNNCSSLRFDMIVCNNLSEIHRMAGNHTKQEKCLQHLLSILMFITDVTRENRLETDTTTNNNTTTTTTPATEALAGFTSTTVASARAKRGRSTDYMDLDGFWDNIVPFLLRSECAEAA